MQKYRIDGAVDVHDVDFNGVAKTSSLMRYIQTAAQGQLTDGGLSYDELKNQNRVFILSRFKMEVLKPLRSCEPVTAVTFAAESRGFSFLRCYSLEQEGVAIAKAISIWALVDTETRNLVPVNSFDLGLTVLPPLDISFEHIRFPSTLTDVGGYGVHYGDVDRNRHMNNTKYPDMYSNFLPMDNKMIKSISINYKNEALIGEKLRVQRAYENGVYYFRTVRGDGKINSEATILLEDLI